jgi:hypothetical protein
MSDYPVGRAILDLVIDGQAEQAVAAVAADYPTSILELPAAGAESALDGWRATSATSNSLTLGVKTFGLDRAAGWRAGYPVLFTETSDPQNRRMSGYVVTDMAGSSDVEVEITQVVGSGTFTSWRAVLVASFVSGVASPVPLSAGGFGVDMATNAAAGRSGTQIGWTIRVRAFDQFNPANFEVAGTPGDYLHISETDPLVGVFIGHPGEIALYNSPGSYTFVAPAGYRTHDLAVQDEGGAVKRRFWDDAASTWRKLDLPDGLSDSAIPVTVTITANEDAARLQSFRLTGTITVTLPAVANWSSTGALPMLIFWSTDALVKTLNVAGGGTINGSSSITFAGAYSARTLIVDLTGGGYVVVGSV